MPQSLSKSASSALKKYSLGLTAQLRYYIGLIVAGVMGGFRVVE